MKNGDISNNHSDSNTANASEKGMMNKRLSMSKNELQQNNANEVIYPSVSHKKGQFLHILGHIFLEIPLLKNHLENPILI